MNNEGMAIIPDDTQPHTPGAHVFAMPEPQSLRDAAYEAIKHRIITCAFRPGEYINEAFVSATLGIGRTPVHQAIDRLMLEGMLDVIPRKGVIVKPVSLDEIMQIIEVRLLNEVYCVRLAADRADADELMHLSDILGRAAQWIEARNSEHLMRLDREFHWVLARASKNVVLGDVLAKLHDRSLRFWFISLNRPGHHESVQAQHEAILAAIKDRDPSGAEQAMRAHIEAFRDNLTRNM
ncbi:MAG: bacterial regulatory s, gntR family protein [Hyphomicrobiales bacterium]|nr:bacterial regulatory s, gntR family protein [Hyphomicrobiales bacterium]